MTILAPILFAVMGCMANPEEITKNNILACSDTINVEDYKIIREQWVFEEDVRAGMTLEFIKDHKSLAKIGDTDIRLYNFNIDKSDSLNKIYTRDINNDGVKEIILECWGGGMHCCINIHVYALADSLRLVSSIDGDVGNGWLSDIDNDTIPEYYSFDQSFTFWNSKSRAGSIFTPLIWKFDSVKYRLANFKFPDYIIGSYGPYYKKPDTLRVDFRMIYTSTLSRFIGSFDKYKLNNNLNDSLKTVQLFPDNSFGSAMANFIYAGYPEFADSLINNVWPADIPGKENYYLKLINLLHSSPFWDDLQKSDW